MAFGVAVFLALTWGIWRAQPILTRIPLTHCPPRLRYFLAHFAPDAFMSSPSRDLRPTLSATIVNERVDAVLPGANIWKLSIDAPHNDFLQSRQQARSFRAVVRRTTDDIKALTGQRATHPFFSSYACRSRRSVWQDQDA